MPDRREERPAVHNPGFRGGPGGPHSMFSKVKPEDPLGTLKRLWGYIKQYKLRFFLIFIIVFVTALLSLINPYLIGRAIDQYIIPKDFKGLFSLIILMISILPKMDISTLHAAMILYGKSSVMPQAWKAIRKILVS